MKKIIIWENECMYRSIYKINFWDYIKQVYIIYVNLVTERS